jgi:hypothetical protein
VEGDEQIENLVEHLMRVGVVAVDLVDDDDRFGAGFEGFAEDEAGLGLGTFGGVDHQQHAVDHVHDAFDFAAEIGVAGGVDDVDVEILVFERGVLGLDGDPFSRSRSMESMIRSSVAMAWLARKVPDCLSRQSTSVVLP